MGAFSGKSEGETRREIERAVRWQREGMQSGAGTACDAIHACATGNHPSLILYFLEIAPDDAVEYAAEVLTHLRTKRNFLTNPYIGRMEPEEATNIVLTLQPVYRQVHDIFFGALEQRRRREDENEVPKQ